MKKNLMIMIGADPEFGLIDTRKKMFTSAHDLVPGTKDKPHPLNKGALQADGCMVEFNIDPAKSAVEFVRNINTVLRQVRKTIPKKYKFAYQPAIVYDSYYFSTLPDDPKLLGCTPDFNAWQNGKINPTPVPKEGQEELRTCSGHIHIGWTKDADIDDPSHAWDCQRVVKALDVVIGPYLKLWDKDTRRSSLYGAEGAFRPKPYGVEWRVPSNAWLNYPKLWPWLFKAIKEVVLNLEKVELSYDLKSSAKFKNSKLIPGFNMRWIGVYEDKKDEVKKKKVIPVGVRIAATSSKINYDLDLDIPDLGYNNYTTPFSLGII